MQGILDSNDNQNVRVCFLFVWVFFFREQSIKTKFSNALLYTSSRLKYPLIVCVNYQISKIMHNVYESTNYALISGLWLFPFNLDIMNRPENWLTHGMFNTLLIKKNNS